MKQYLPFLDWMTSYSKEQFTGDLSAGLTVGVMLIPQGMAYAMLAGMPPIYGLYAATIPLIIYALLGTSRQLAVGPVAMVSILIASGVGAIADLGGESFIALAILLALMVGLIQFLLGVLRLGFVVNFLSHPVISGFTAAAAIIIIFSQLPHILGINIPRASVFETAKNIFSQLGNTNILTLGIGVAAVLIIIALKKINKRLPAPLAVVLLGLAVVYFFNLQNLGVRIIAEIPSGLPAFAMPTASYQNVSALLPLALTISLVSFMESIAVSKAIQRRHDDYEIDASQELRALGLANIGGSFFQSFPTTGGFSRTAVNDQAGALTGIASLISAGIVLLTLLFLTDYFYYLPKAVLAAIILVAVYGLIDFSGAKHLWQTDKKDFAAFAITGLATLIFGIEEGILVGVFFSIMMILYKVAYPHIAELGQVPNSSTFRNVDRFDNLEQFENILILRFDAQLFFANANIFKDTVFEKLKAKNKIEYVIIEASVINNLDSSALHMLCDLYKELSERKIELIFTDVKGPVRDKFNKNKFFDALGSSNFYLSVEDAVLSINEAERVSFEKFINQYNPVN